MGSGLCFFSLDGYCIKIQYTLLRAGGLGLLSGSLRFLSGC